jgi:methylase of polypeptide subunit release factors
VTAIAAAAAALRAGFDRAGYDLERVAEALQVDPPAGPDAAVENRLRLGDDPLGLLVRLFLAGERVPAAPFTDAELAEALELGLLRRAGDELEAPVAVAPWGGLLVVHDHEAGEVTRADHVAGIAAASRTLASMTVRRPARRALDVGTGNALQALLLARHADEVVATEVNPRALELAATTLRLNTVSNVELREGSFFEPVEGERFDLIATNPPWVVSPDSTFLFRDGGLEGDELSRLFVRTLPRHLTDGGIATALACWAHGASEDWSAPVRRWLADSGCDAVIVRYVGDDAISYAANWSDGDDERWLAHYRAAGIEQLATGAVVLHRRARGGGGRMLALDAHDAPTGVAGEQLLRILGAFDYDGDLTGERLALVPHTLDEQLVWTEDGYAPERLVLRPDDSIGVEVPVEPAALPALFRLDGSQHVGELPGTAAALPTIRRLFELGAVERVR